MDLNERNLSWRAASEVIDLTTEVGTARYNDLRDRAARGEIRGFTKTDTAYNQKEGDYLAVCEWWEPGEAEEEEE
jgi:hypothetical protein